ncbi:MAG: hypothetical protein PHC34_08110 [Candidatus Gastranaerophilales bacterium]|nr:hypothetical protein [Candidatus Gastranaerophilales bacterium]
METENCCLCNSSISNKHSEDMYTTKGVPESWQYDCPICGRVKYEDIALLEKICKDEILKIKARYYFSQNKKQAENLTRNNFEAILNNVPYPTSLLGKIKLVLDHYYRETKYLFHEITINIEQDYPLFFCRNTSELEDIIKYLYDNELILGPEYFIGETTFHLTPKGIGYIEELEHNPKSKQCFVAMWFSKNTENLYNKAIKPAIEGDPNKNPNDEVYGTGYSVRRIDEKQHINYITDELIKEIRHSKFIIADLTGNRGGVYYEAGFAFGLGLPVILTCHKDWQKELSKNCGCKRDGIHFDLQQKNILFWTDDPNDTEYSKYNLVEFKKALIARIGAVVGLNK